MSELITDEKLSRAFNVRKVVIVGAGASGLCALHHFSADPSYDVTVYEQASALGGIWIFNSGNEPANETYSNNLSSCNSIDSQNEAANTVTFPVPLATSNFVDRKVLSTFTRDYAEQFDLIRYIKFRREVLRVSPLGNPSARNWPQWSVKVVDLETEEAENVIADILLLCNGFDGKPYMPELPGLDKFAGTVVHSSEYNSSDSYRNQNVLIVGRRGSANEIAFGLMKTARKVIIVPEKMVGAEDTTSTFLPDFSKYLPSQQRVIHYASRAFDYCAQFICQQPPTEFSDQQTEPSSRIFKAAKGLCFKESCIVLADGTTELIDTVILATGFDYDFPYLSPDCCTEVNNGRVSPLYRHIIHAEFHSLAFVGLLHIVPFTATEIDWRIRFYKAFLDGKKKNCSSDHLLQNLPQESDEDGGEDYITEDDNAGDPTWTTQMINELWPHSTMCVTQPKLKINTIPATPIITFSKEQPILRPALRRDSTKSVGGLERSCSQTTDTSAGEMESRSRRGSMKTVQLQLGNRVLSKSPLGYCTPNDEKSLSIDKTNQTESK